MARRLVWEQDGRGWPHAASSRFVQAAGLRWHVQQLGPDGAPVLLLLHGTGASTHSWRGLMSALADRFHIVAPDLPGHAFTDMPASPRQLGLPGMAGAVAALMATLGRAPALVVGHSAGAAIGARLCLDGALAPHALVSLNGALLPLSGLAGQVFSPLARLLTVNTLVPRLFSWRAADPAVLKRLLDGTGSALDAAGAALYGRLVANPGHVAGALGMITQWDLQALQRDLPRLATPLHLVVGARDRTVPPREQRRVRGLVPGATWTELPGLGHLAHEEQPAELARLLAEMARGAGLLGAMAPGAFP